MGFFPRCELCQLLLSSGAASPPMLVACHQHVCRKLMNKRNLELRTFTEKDMINLGTAFNGTLVGLVEKQGGDGWIPSIDTWRMSSIQKRSVLLVDVPDNKYATWFANWAVKQQVGEHIAKQKKVTGSIELATVVATPTGAILHILVDNETIKTMANVNFELNIGFSGLVKFQDPTGKKSTAKTIWAEAEGVSMGTSRAVGASTVSAEATLALIN